MPCISPANAPIYMVAAEQAACGESVLIDYFSKSLFEQGVIFG